MTQQCRCSGSDRNQDISRRGTAREPLVGVVTLALALAMISYPSFSQTASMLDAVHPLDGPLQAFNIEELGSADANARQDSAALDNPGDPNSPKHKAGSVVA